MNLASYRNRYINVKNSPDVMAHVREIMPMPAAINSLTTLGSVSEFSASVIYGIEVHVSEFIEIYGKLSFQTLRLVRSTTKNNSDIWHRVRCQHRTNNEKTFNPDQNDRRLQNCDCPFYLVLKNINLPGNIKRTEVTINHRHTHPTKALEALSFREISEDSKVKLNCLFELGYSPSKAFHEFSLRLKAQYPDPTVYQLKSADRAILPKRTDFNNLYKSYTDAKYGSRNAAAIYTKLTGNVLVKYIRIISFIFIPELKSPIIRFLLF